jgi:hypothetical protein
MLPQLTAVQFERFMASGRTSPALCGCENEAGTFVGDYVIKLRGTAQISGLISELVAHSLAHHFGIATFDAAFVGIGAGIVEAVTAAEPSMAHHFQASTGCNFGTRHTTGASPWPVDKTIPAILWQAAVDIFAFDALIQNPDRRYNNQNVLVLGDRFLAYDHEAAFSFSLAILASPTPWTLADQPYLQEHVFYRRLKGKPMDLAGFLTSLKELSDILIAKIVADIPEAWNNGNVAGIERHLRLVRDHADEFADAVRRFLI